MSASPPGCPARRASTASTPATSPRRGGGDSDPQLLARILDEDLTFVTNDGKDFRPMISRTELHPGVIAIPPNVRKERQMVLFAAAFAEITAADPPLDMVDTVLEVDADGHVERYDLPPGT